MGAPYQVANLSDGNGLLGLFSFVNNSTEGFFFPMITMIIWIITFVATKQLSSAKAFTFATFICMILSSILTVLDLMSAKYMYLFIVLLAAGALWLKFDEA